MPHLLADPRRSPLQSPITFTMRYECPCHGREVLQVSAVISVDLPEDMLVSTFKTLLADMRIEIGQHARPEPEPEPEPVIAVITRASGDACAECGNFTLVRAGTCLTCQTCGSTTGCS